MQVEVKIDRSYDEPKIIILTASMTEEIHTIVKKLTDHAIPQVISGNKDNKIEVLEQADLIRVYTGNGKVFAVTNNGEYTLRLRLYEVEKRLDPQQFVRVSHTEIINIRKAKSFDCSFTGTICVKLSDGAVTYVSRRYVPKIKKILGI